MKSPSFRQMFVSVLASLSMLAIANPTAQPQMQFTPGLQGSYNVDWEGVTGRTYFMQFSMNLTDWQYAPFIDFGDGGHHRGLHSDAPKFFVRLHYGDFEGIDSLDDAMNADFDGDGISNIVEVTYGYDPFLTSSSLEGPDAGIDPDGDGLGNVAEQLAGTDLMQRDHPAVQLEVIID
jgi:hypothetical protein